MKLPAVLAAAGFMGAAFVVVLPGSALTDDSEVTVNQCLEDARVRCEIEGGRR